MALSRVAAVAAITVFAAAGLTACSSGRSVEAYCSTMAEHKDRYLTAMEAVNANDNPLAGLLGMVSALGDLQGMWDAAAKVAPEEIAPDVETVAEYWSTQLDLAEKIVNDPLSGLASTLMQGATVSAPIERVDRYTAEKCPDVGGMFLDYKDQ